MRHRLRAPRLYVAGCLPQGSHRETCHGDAELAALSASDTVRSRIVGLAVDIAAKASLARLEAFPGLRLLALSTRGREVSPDLPLSVLPRLRYLDLAGWQGDVPGSGMLLPLFRQLRTLRWPASLRGPVPVPCQLERVSGPLTEDGARALAACSRLRELSSDQLEFRFTSAEPIAALRHLERLHLRHFRATELAALAGLVELRRLSLSASAAADFDFLARLPRLESLDLSQSKLSSLAALAHATGLRELDVGFTDVSDLAPLRALTGLVRLRLHHTQAVDLGPLAALRGLKELSVANTAVVELQPLAGHPALEWVILYESRVTDIAPLFTLPRLRRANIARLSLSAAQKQQLLQRLGRSNVDDF
ncbi:MAG: leucine-rich repeat domain-containing protein [Polyangia bacterium]